MFARLRSSPLVLLALLALATAVTILAQSSSDDDERSTVLWIPYQGVIGSVTANYFVDALDYAQEIEAVCVVIELDTPGGLDTSMRKIIKAMLASDIPTIVYVSPSGSRAASAGTFLAMAAHKVAMAPGTNLGAAHPVNVSGQTDSLMSEKVTNDAVAYIRSLANRRGRDQQWVEDAVRMSVSLSAEEALEMGITDVVVSSRDELFEALNGSVVEVGSEDVTLDLADVRIEEFPMSRRYRILGLLNDPTVAYMLIMFGFYGIFFELSSPGTFIPGIAGVICLVLGLYAMQSLSIGYAGLLLMILGVSLFILELFTPSFGVFATGGVVALAVGSVLLFRSADPILRVSYSVIIPTVGFSGAFFFFAAWMAVRAKRKPPVTGRRGLHGRTGDVRSRIDKEGTVFVDGAHWTARADSTIEAGERIIVERVDGLVLHVRKADHP